MAFCSSLSCNSNFLIAQLIVFTLIIIARMIPAKSIKGSKTFTEMPFAIAGNFERKIKLPPTNTSSIASPSIILKSATQRLKIKVLSWVVIFPMFFVNQVDTFLWTLQSSKLQVYGESLICQF